MWRAAAPPGSSSGSASMASSSAGMSSRSSAAGSVVATGAASGEPGRKYMTRGLRDEDPPGTGPPTRILNNSRDRSSTTSMPRRFEGRKLSRGFRSERSRTSRRDFSSSCRMEERPVMGGRLCFEATRLAGRVGASGGALPYSRCREERNREEGARVGARGARVWEAREPAVPWLRDALRRRARHVVCRACRATRSFLDSGASTSGDRTRSSAGRLPPRP